MQIESIEVIFLGIKMERSKTGEGGLAELIQTKQPINGSRYKGR